MKSYLTLTKKKDELNKKLEELDSEKLLTWCCVAMGGWLALCGAYMLGRWRVARYMSGIICLANKEGLINAPVDTINGFMLRTPEKVVTKAWKDGLIK